MCCISQAQRQIGVMTCCVGSLPHPTVPARKSSVAAPNTAPLAATEICDLSSVHTTPESSPGSASAAGLGCWCGPVRHSSLAWCLLTSVPGVVANGSRRGTGSQGFALLPDLAHHTARKSDMGRTLPKPSCLLCPPAARLVVISFPGGGALPSAGAQVPFLALVAPPGRYV